MVCLRPSETRSVSAIVLENLDGHLVAHVEHLGGVVHAAPAHVGDMQQPVDATEVDERTVLGDVLDGAPVTTWPSSQVLASVCCLSSVALLSRASTRRLKARCCHASC